MASKKTPLQGSKMDSASSASTAATNPAVEVYMSYRIVWKIGGADEGWKDGPPGPKEIATVVIKGKSTSGSNMINCVATLSWDETDANLEFSCAYDSKTGVLSGFECMDKDLFGENFIEDMSMSMKGKSPKDAEEAAEKEVLDDSDDPFLFVLIAFVDNEKGMLYGKNFVDSAMVHECVLSGEEIKRLRLE